MKAIINVFFIILPIYFFSQSLSVKILNTNVKNTNVKIKILIKNKSNKLFLYNKEIGILDIKNDSLKKTINLIAFYEGDKWINIPGMHYGKFRIRKTKIIKIHPHSEKVITIDLKKNLPLERYRGFYLNMSILKFEILNYILRLYFKSLENDLYEKYDLSNNINMISWKS